VDKYEQGIIDWCEGFKEKLLDKYRKGRVEHGGSPVDVDCGKEVSQEVYDIINYFVIHNVNTTLE